LKGWGKQWGRAEETNGDKEHGKGFSGTRGWLAETKNITRHPKGVRVGGKELAKLFGYSYRKEPAGNGGGGHLTRGQF